MLCGKPLIAWAIAAAKNSGIFDKIVVSTDGIKISDIAMQYGADEVWERPPELATKNAHISDAVAYHLCKQDETYDYVQLLHATNPLVTGIDILKAAQFMHRKQADFVISVCKSDVPLGVAKPIPPGDYIRNWFPRSLRNKNRQEVEQTWQLDGNIYIGKYEIFKENKDYWDTKIYAYKMPISKYCDIDDETDFTIAQTRLEGKSWLAKILSK
jgi:CMP-N-acetylneuraminic acid synthetase